jgi:hypothetical protein
MTKPLGSGYPHVMVRPFVFVAASIFTLGAACGSSSNGATSSTSTGDAAAGDGPVEGANGGADVGSSGETGSSGDSATPSDSGSPSEASVDGGPACAAAQVGPNADFKGYRMFPANHPLNMAIDTLPVNAQSANWLANCSPAAPHLQLDLSMPYNIVAANTPPVTATKFDYNSTPYPNPWPFPANAIIEGGDPTTPGDHHLLAFDVGDCQSYEVYNILWSADHSSFTAASGTVWDTAGNGNGSGADAAGLPILPLIVRYDEVIEAGAIEHALRFTCTSTQSAHIAPARASASSITDPTYPPMGMRVRLKASYDPTAQGYPAPIVTLLKAIQKYGLILADNGGAATPLFISGATDMPLYNAFIGPAYLLKMITTDDLEAVDSGPVVTD